MSRRRGRRSPNPHDRTVWRERHAPRGEFTRVNIMCFSAVASFVTAAVTGVIGVASLARVKDMHEFPLAAAPVLFAVQQGMEGLLWLNLPLAADGSMATGLTLIFLLFAEVLWPVYAPVAVLLAEPDARRRRLILPCLGLGIAVAAYLAWRILTGAHTAHILDGHIVYVTTRGQSNLVAFAYIAATSLPLLISSRRVIVGLGAIIFVGGAVAYAAYSEAFVSVWCFFGAAASSVIVFHFEHARRRRSAPATA